MLDPLLAHSPHEDVQLRRASSAAPARAASVTNSASSTAPPACCARRWSPPGCSPARTSATPCARGCPARTCSSPRRLTVRRALRRATEPSRPDAPGRQPGARSEPSPQVGDAIPHPPPPLTDKGGRTAWSVLMDRTRSILLVEEDHVVRSFLADNLTADGFELTVAEDKTAALDELRHMPDLVLCDVNGQTLDLIDAIRNADGFASRIDPDTPLIVLTTRTDELTRVRYFERGSDDVIGKPFCYPELLARVRAVLRRVDPHTRGRIVRVGELRVDTAGRAVEVAGQAVELAAKEYALLVHLAGDPARVFTKEELLRDVWGFRTQGAQPHAGLARHPPAQQAARRHRRAVGHQRVGRRLPARARRPGRGRTERGVKRRAALQRTRSLQPGAPPARRTALRRKTPLARGGAPSAPARRADATTEGTRRAPGAASDAQRAKINGAWCIVCQQTKGLTPAHLAARARGGCDHPDCVVPLCWTHHRAFDTGRLDLLPYLEPRWRPGDRARRRAPRPDQRLPAADRRALSVGRRARLDVREPPRWLTRSHRPSPRTSPGGSRAPRRCSAASAPATCTNPATPANG